MEKNQDIENQDRQRDLTKMIEQLIKLRNERFTGRMVVIFRDGRAVKAGVKK